MERHHAAEFIKRQSTVAFCNIFPTSDPVVNSVGSDAHFGGSWGLLLLHTSSRPGIRRTLKMIYLVKQLIE